MSETLVDRLYQLDHNHEVSGAAPSLAVHAAVLRVVEDLAYMQIGIADVEAAVTAFEAAFAAPDPMQLQRGVAAYRCFQYRTKTCFMHNSILLDSIAELINACTRPSATMIGKHSSLAKPQNFQHLITELGVGFAPPVGVWEEIESAARKLREVRDHYVVHPSRGPSDFGIYVRPPGRTTAMTLKQPDGEIEEFRSMKEMAEDLERYLELVLDWLESDKRLGTRAS